MDDRLKEKPTYNVITYSHRDKYEWVSSAFATIEYDRVTGIQVSNGDHTQFFGSVPPESDRKSFYMSQVMIKGLSIALNRINNVEHINCNLFSRLLHADYTQLAQSDPDGVSWYPIEKAPSKARETKTLGMGAVGVIALESRGSVHSLVGLGEDSGLGIQVMSHGAELAMVLNEEVIDFYQNLNPETGAGLYAIQ